MANERRPRGAKRRAKRYPHGGTHPARKPTALERRLLDALTPDHRVHRVLAAIAEQQLLFKTSPTPGEVWGLYWHGDRARLPVYGQRVERAREDRHGRVRTVQRPERADVLPTLHLLRLYGVRWEPNPADEGRPHQVHLIGPAYEHVLPYVKDRLATEGRWPPTDPGGTVVNYRGPKRWTAQRRGWRPA